MRTCKCGRPLSYNLDQCFVCSQDSCSGCDLNLLPKDGGHCYMFFKKPKEKCGQFTPKGKSDYVKLRRGLYAEADILKKIAVGSTGHIWDTVGSLRTIVSSLNFKADKLAEIGRIERQLSKYQKG